MSARRLVLLVLFSIAGQTVETAAGEQAVTEDQAVSIRGERVGDWLRYAGCRFAVPPGVSLHWPALPHNPYRKDGRAAPGEGRLVVCIPFDRDHLRQQVTLTVEP